VRSIDVMGKRVGTRKSQVYKPFVYFWFKNRGMKNVIFLLRENMSKRQIMNVTERFRCHILACSQVRCQGFASGQIGCFSDFTGVVWSGWM